jgi:hypothetical protein
MPASSSRGCFFQLKWVIIIFLCFVIALSVVFLGKELVHSFRAQMGFEAPDVVLVGATAYTDYSLSETYGHEDRKGELYDLATFAYNTVREQPKADKLVIQVTLGLDYSLYTDKYGNKVAPTYQTKNLVLDDLAEIRRYKQDYDYAGDENLKLFYTDFLQELRSEEMTSAERQKLAEIYWQKQKEGKSLEIESASQKKPTSPTFIGDPIPTPPCICYS